MISNLTNIQPIQNKQLSQLNALLSGLNAEQKIWLSGYLAGQTKEEYPSHINEQSAKANHSPKKNLCILYGSQTGNARFLAEEYHQKAQLQGLHSSLISLESFKPRQILKENNIVLIVSTHGEGEAPDDAEIFYEYVFSKNPPQLKHLNYSVLALGDSSYDQYCQTGKDFDIQFEKLGANRVFKRVDCDVNFEHDAKYWQTQSLLEYSKVLDASHEGSSQSKPLSLLKTQEEVVFNRNNPFSAEVLTVQKLTTDESIKNVFHIELSIEDSGLDYSPGNSLAVLASNDHSHVNDLLTLLHLNQNETINYEGKEITLKSLFTDVLEISQLNRQFLSHYAALAEHTALQNIINNQVLYKEFVAKNQLYDVIKHYPSAIKTKELIRYLAPIQPRLYSIASSLKANPEEVHLTISLVQTNDNRTGLVSGQLCQATEVGDQVKVYIEGNNNFRIPNNTDTPTIMIGSGTGVAPFRAFMQERQALNHRGNNWLIFGNPSFANDFLYQLEWQDFFHAGTLNEIDLAFSRDQESKIYVQDKLSEKSAQLWEWLENGAHIYLCGDKQRMAQDVESTLLTIIQKFGHKSMVQAQDYLKQLRRSKRYQKDVY